MPSKWIEHVKKVAAQKKIPYKDAMKVAKESYKPEGKKMIVKTKEEKPKPKAKKAKKEEPDMPEK